jgi:hypothetical protein
MNTKQLPETVIQALGPQASRDLVAWLEARLPLHPDAPQIRISAFVARQKVNVLMLERVSNLLLAGEPALEQGADGAWQWRVPIDLTLADRGRVGRVGELAVDAQYGTVHEDEQQLTRITAAAQRLADEVLTPSP